MKLSEKLRDIQDDIVPYEPSVAPHKLESAAKHAEALEAVAEANKKALKFVNWRCTEGLVSHCIRCDEHPIELDMIVTDELWDALDIPTEWKPDVLCPTCIGELAERAGYDLGDHIVAAYFTGGGTTTPVIPARPMRDALDRLQELSDD